VNAVPQIKIKQNIPGHMPLLALQLRLINHG